MSEQPDQTRICPTCGNTVPAMARYCPSCGTRLDPATAYTADDFEDALADVLEAPVEDAPIAQPAAQPLTPTPSPVSADQPTAALPPITAPTPGQHTEWTASPSDWATSSGQPGTWTAQPPTATTPARQRGNRTLWIILAIVGFIIFCCCGSFFALLLVAENDTAFQQEVSNLAMLWIS
jgi:hypothetical protein